MASLLAVSAGYLLTIGAWMRVAIPCAYALYMGFFVWLSFRLAPPANNPEPEAVQPRDALVAACGAWGMYCVEWSADHPGADLV